MVSTNKLVEKVYTNLSQPAAYSSAQKIHNVLLRKGYKTPGIYKIKKWLQNQDDYSLQRPIRRQFKRARVVVSSFDEQLDVDLLDMQSLAKYNDNVKYLLVTIDVFSRYVRVRPLKNKTAKAVEKSLADILSNVNVKKIRTDGGGEFNNKWIKQLLKEKNIYHHITLNEVKANYVERFNKTLKTMIFKYLNRQKTNTYLNVLQKLVQSYNSTPHRSLNNIAPKDVNDTNSANLWAFLYLAPSQSKSKINDKTQGKKTKTTKRKQLYKFRKGQLVRISHQRKIFTRAYNEQWSYEVFKIYKRFQIQAIPMYKLKDLLELEIDGNFYQSELQAVDKSEETLWEIEKILHKKKRSNSMQYFVKWRGYPKRFNSWVDESAIQNIN